MPLELKAIPMTIEMNAMPAPLSIMFPFVGHEFAPEAEFMNVNEARYYAHELRPNWTAASRTDMTETVFFNSANRTSADGKVRGSFYLSDLIT